LNALILYQSRGGHTRQAAEAIAQAVRGLNHPVTTKSVIEVRPADVEAADLLFVGTWVQGFILFGVKPAGADLWTRALPSLAGKPTGVYCTYAVHPRGSLRALKALLEARGAAVVGDHAFHRRHPTAGAEGFARRIVEVAGRAQG